MLIKITDIQTPSQSRFLLFKLDKLLISLRSSFSLVLKSSVGKINN